MLGRKCLAISDFVPNLRERFSRAANIAILSCSFQGRRKAVVPLCYEFTRVITPPSMKKKCVSESGAFNPRIFATFLLCAFAALLALVSLATTPPNGTISDSSTSVTYTGGPITVPTNATDNASGPVTCNAADPCDDFPLHIDISDAYRAAHPDYVLKIEVSWSDPTDQQDLDIFLVNNPDNGPYPAHG